MANTESARTAADNASRHPSTRRTPPMSLPTTRTDNGTVWTHDHDDVYKTTNGLGDVIHALTSDFEDDEQED